VSPALRLARRRLRHRLLVRLLRLPRARLGAGRMLVPRELVGVGAGADRVQLLLAPGEVRLRPLALAPPVLGGARGGVGGIAADW
jgi:hypothetical protein